MKLKLSSFLFLLLMGAFVVGCGAPEPTTSTEGATPDALAEYEAALAEAEGSMAESEEANAPEE